MGFPPFWRPGMVVDRTPSGSKRLRFLRSAIRLAAHCFDEVAFSAGAHFALGLAVVAAHGAGTKALSFVPKRAACFESSLQSVGLRPDYPRVGARAEFAGRKTARCY